MTECPICSRWETDSDMRICERERSYVVLNRDQYFPGYVLLFTKIHQTELFQLDRTVRCQLIEEVSEVAAALYAAFNPAKINYELLGNMVPHIHWHLVPRFTTEALWPRPIWAEAHTEVVLTADEYSRRIALIRSCLS